MSASDDIVLPFRMATAGVIGRLVRLGPVADAVLSRHDYAEPVSAVLGQALALAALLGTALKPDSKFILQTRSDGPLGFLVVNFEGPGRLRGYASLADAADPQALGQLAEGALIGRGHLAMTIDPGGSLDRYQGIVPLEGQPLLTAAHGYFERSEQIPTLIRLAVARHYRADGGPAHGWHWRIGGLMLQYVTGEVGVRRELRGRGAWSEPVGDAQDWERNRMLAATVEDHELTDPTLGPERLLYRLFHEEGVSVFHPRPIEAHCPCSRDRLGRLLGQFADADIAEMVEADGQIRARCEYCNTTYSFSRAEIGR
jgi:molecular chaperone Hsp33